MATRRPADARSAPGRCPRPPSRCLRPLGRRGRSAALLAAGASLLTGCLLADPPPDPESAPIEIVATTSTRPDDDCLLNRDEVGAGPHQVVLFSDQASADVRVLDAGGRIVFSGRAGPQDLEHLPEEVEPPATPVVRLSAGTYRVECVPDGGPPSAAVLRVVPARPGFEDVEPDG